MQTWILAILIGAPVATAVGGYYARIYLAKTLDKSLEAKTQKIIDNAKSEAKEILLDAKDEAIKSKEKAEKETEEKQKGVGELENKLRDRETMLDQRSSQLDEDRRTLSDKIKEVENFKIEIKRAKEDQLKVLEKISKTTKEQARQILLDLTEKEAKEEVVRKLKEIEEQGQEEVDSKAREVLSAAIQRLASDATAERTVSTVSIPSDEMKGRIIGREGRNIQAFEKELGVDLIIDDTPEVVVISCFDPIRREVARNALEKLVADGRIHPTRIEEMVVKAKSEVAAQIKEAGEQAAYEVGVTGLDPDLIKILGRLKFRTSYGQNVLRHSIEVAHLSGMIAEDLKADVTVAKKAGLLHDIGKAVDHEIQGSHAIIGRDIGKKYKLSPEVIHAIEAHHEDVEIETPEAAIVQAADAISSSRPGARRETLESYLKRLEDLEMIANSFEGVGKSYAIQAGREVRIIVTPEEIDDVAAEKLSHDIARKIEKDMDYPGQIKVNVIRETRAVDFAK